MFRRPKNELFLPLNVNRSELEWLIRFRWLALLLQLGCGAFAFRYLLLYREFQLPFYGVLLTLGLFNLYSLSLLRSNGEIRASAIFIQLAVDVSAFTGVLILTGGSRNPLVLLFLGYAALGAILLRYRLRWSFLGLLLLSGLTTFRLRNLQVLSAELYLFDAIPILSLGFCLVGVWCLISWLTDTLDVFRKEKAERAQTQNRLDHLRALGALTAELSHQFATPLNTAKLKAERIERKVSNPQTAEDFLVLKEALHQCEQVLRQIGHIQKSELELKEMPMGEFLLTLVEKWESTSGVRVEKRFHVNGSRCLLPPIPFAHALFNVLDNSARTGVKKIEVRAKQMPNALQVSVLDKGPGFPPSVLQDLGKPFVTNHPEGTGLGLYNCVTLCEAMGGSLTLRNPKLGGAEVIFLLPTVPGEAT